jgi:hypothetical protein
VKEARVLRERSYENSVVRLSLHGCRMPAFYANAATKISVVRLSLHGCRMPAFYANAATKTLLFGGLSLHGCRMPAFYANAATKTLGSDCALNHGARFCRKCFEKRLAVESIGAFRVSKE